MNKRFEGLFLLALLCLCGILNGYGCGSGEIDMKKQIANYKGDGAIKYLEKPNVLGCSGVLVDFPDFDLSTDFHAQYNISGLPSGKDYLVYFIPSVPVNADALHNGICSYSIKKEGQIIEEKSAQIAQMQREIGANGSKYYFYKRGSGPEYIDIEAQNEKLTLAVTYVNRGNLSNGRAFFRIARGAFK